MNVFERQAVLQDAIRDAEWRLGSYLAIETCEKTDAYAKHQIRLINAWEKELNELCSVQLK